MEDFERRKTILELEDVSVTFPNGMRALKPSSLKFYRGEFAVLLGPSGSGKSTLLRCLNLLQEPTTGRVSSPWISGPASESSARVHRRRIGMVFQQHQLVLSMTALDNVMAGMAGSCGLFRAVFPSDAMRIEALECLDRVGLAGKAMNRASELSGGEQQRVGIARALAQKPDAILADEPVASLDPARASRLMGLFKKICGDSGITAVVSLHQVSLAREFADRIVGLRAGEIVFDAPASELDDSAVLEIYADSAALSGGGTGARRSTAAPREARERELAGAF